MTLLISLITFFLVVLKNRQSGPFNVKEEILSLDHIEAWLGQRNPMKLGEEGAKEDASAGVTLLQEIIKNNDESSHNDDEIEDVRTGWIDRVGEGRTEDENLSLYYRFVEGVEEDSKWIRKGFSDLSSYHNSAKVSFILFNLFTNSHYFISVFLYSTYICSLFSHALFTYIILFASFTHPFDHFLHY